jgi:hypothetical protein
MSKYKRIKPLVPHIEDDDVVIVRIPQGTSLHKKDEVLSLVRKIAKQLEKNQSFWDFL